MYLRSNSAEMGENVENRKLSKNADYLQWFRRGSYDSENKRIISMESIFVEIWQSVHRDFQVLQWNDDHVSTNMAPCLDEYGSEYDISFISVVVRSCAKTCERFNFLRHQLRFAIFAEDSFQKFKKIDSDNAVQRATLSFLILFITVRVTRVVTNNTDRPCCC